MNDFATCVGWLFIFAAGFYLLWVSLLLLAMLIVGCVEHRNERKQKMNSIKILLLMAAVVATAGCSSVQLSPSVVQVGVSTGVRYSVAKYPESIPYLKAVTPIVCSAAYATNLAPEQVIAAIESSPASALKTPEATLILNSALTLYVGIWASYAQEPVFNAPLLREYLLATCNGLQDGIGLPSEVRTAAPTTPWPRVRFP